MRKKERKWRGERKREMGIEGDKKGRKAVPEEKRGGEGGESRRGLYSRTTIHLYYRSDRVCV